MDTVSLEWAKRKFKKGYSKEFQHALNKESYWTPQVFDLMVNRCDEIIFENPSDGLVAAQILLKLAGRVRDIGRGRQAMALAVLGSACRVNIQYGQARECYLKALALARNQDPKVRGGVLQRFAVLEWSEGNLEKALVAIEESLELLDGHAFGVSLIIRGGVRSDRGDFKKSAEDHGLALRLVKPASREYICALRELSDSLMRMSDIDALGGAIKVLAAARKGINEGRNLRRTLVAYIDWVEGNIYARLGSHRIAITKIRKACKRFMAMKGTYLRDYALATNDLVRIYEDSGDLEAALDCAEDAIQLTTSLPESTNLKEWLEEHQNRKKGAAPP